ncbi:hypothetical protein HY637_00370 [Candidatus Woesearchaeota archaeon]|nr:hypothetical protein [Candidatus Woesearchaeota archaeon]
MAKSRQVKGKCLQVFASSRLAQSSLEYLMIVALTFAIIIPTTYLFFQYSKESGQELIDAQVTKLGRSIVDSAETMFYSGEGSRTILELNVPDGVTDVLVIDGREIVFNITTSFGTSEIVFFSRVNITTLGANCNAKVCRIPELGQEGFKNLKLESIDKNSVSLETV